MAKRIFVSDVHMGAGRSLVEGYKGRQYDWLDKDEALAFASFLDFTAKDTTVDEVILLGDIFDTWVYPVDEVPPVYDEILKAGLNQPVIDALKALSGAGKRVVYVTGNHDMTVSAPFLTGIFPKIEVAESYGTGQLYADHGHPYDMFNAKDSINGPKDSLPLGYYISRVAATNAKRTGSDNSPRYFIDDFIKELVNDNTAVEAVFKGIADEAGLTDESMISLPSGEISLGNVKLRYSDLFKQWGDKRLVSPTEALLFELQGLAPAARKLNETKGYNVLIFGHTHNKYLEKLKLYYDNDVKYILANTGTWCENTEKGKPFSYVETEDLGGKLCVKLKGWDGKRDNRLVPDEYADV